MLKTRQMKVQTVGHSNDMEISLIYFMACLVNCDAHTMYMLEIYRLLS